MTRSQRDIEKLRRKAEELHKLADGGKELSPFEGDALKLLHELEVYQIELELSNEELEAARDEAENLSQKYTALYDFAPMGYLTLDHDGNIQQLNLQAAKILDQPRSVFLGKNFRQFIHLDYREAFDDFLGRISELEGKQICEVKIINQEMYSAGHFIMEGIRSNGIDNNLIALVDISDQKELEKQLIKAQKQAEENDRLKSVFLSNMTHEIRTPLNSILGFSSLLGEKDITQEERGQFLRHINFAGKRMARLVSDILDISKIESNQLLAIHSPCHINLLIDEVLSQFPGSEINPDTKIKSLKGLSDKDSIVMTDEQRLSQALTNLIENAKKFTPEGSIEFGYTLVNEELQFYVQDTGIGISAADQTQIFERFNQATKDHLSVHTGVGLGLSIVKGIVALLKGRIWVESTPGEGSTFYFTIPYVPASEAIETTIEESTHDISGVTVLVVEDSPTNQLFFKTILKQARCNVLSAHNGKEAVQLVAINKSIDIIVMDINMPVMNGFEATKIIKEYNKDIPIIAQTGEAIEGETEKLLDDYFVDVLIKPVVKRDFINIIYKHTIKR